MERSQKHGADDIRKWHLARGWSNIGYHLIINTDAKVEYGRSFNKIGAHVKKHNRENLGICVCGEGWDWSTDQVHVLIEQVQSIRLQHNIPIDNIKGHNEYTAFKTCPNMNMEFLRLILKSMD